MTDQSSVKGVTIVSEQGIQFVPCVPGETSDGYHTFDELYEHRCLLFVALMRKSWVCSWRSRLHDDGTGFEGWFIAGMNLRVGETVETITYHLPNRLWDLLDGVTALERAPKWDGHTSRDVVKRLTQWIEESGKVDPWSC